MKPPPLVMRAAAATIWLLAAVPIAAAQDAGQSFRAFPTEPASHADPAKPRRSTPATHARNQHRATRMAALAATNTKNTKKDHRLILQVNTNDAGAMNLALNNATNVTDYYKALGEKVKIEVVTFGPGLHMLRSDTSPVKARIEEMSLRTPEISFKACGNTREKMQRAEDKEIPIIPQAQIVKSGVVRVMELQEHGWSYVKP